MAEGLALILVSAALGRSQHKASVLDGAGPDEHMPVRLARLPRECGGYGKERCSCFRQRAVERREAQVVADRQAEPSPRQIRDDAKVAGTETARFAIALTAGEIDIEHVDLIIAGDDLAVAVDQKRPIGGTIRGNLDRRRA